MDQPTQAIAEYAAGVRAAMLDPSTVAAATRHLIDSVGCALGAVDAPPVAIARRIASTASSGFGASVIGLQDRTTTEQAAFANTCALRYLDFNDTGIGGHPSDMIPAVLAVAEPRQASGRMVVAAIHAAYEVFAALRRGGFAPRGWNVDQAQNVVGAAAGAGFILGLDCARMANAVSLAITPNIPLRATRAGRLSEWKGCATAHGAMMGVLAARWAHAGLTGPPEPFNGIGGLCQLVGIEPLRMERIGEQRGGLGALQSTGLKLFPAQYNAQGPLASILELRSGLRLDDVDRIDVGLHWGGWYESGGGQGDREEKWNPSTRESADHSLPYALAVALLDGEVTPASFGDDRRNDPALRALMQRITVREDPALTREHAGEVPNWPSSVEVVLRTGQRLARRIRWPKGHPRNPLSDGELEAKFHRLAQRALPPAGAQRLLDTLWRLDELDDIGALTGQFRAIRCADTHPGSTASSGDQR